MGFLDNANVKIPMPKHLSMIESGLRKVGQDKIADSFVESMNRAAEKSGSRSGERVYQRNQRYEH